MSFQALKTGFFVAVLSVFLAACSSTATDETAGAGGLAGADGGANAGNAGAGGAYGDNLGIGGLATVFYFDFDKATLKDEARAALNTHAQHLKSTPVYIRLEGHGDERGTREYNMALGERRANAVREYLVLQGVNNELLEVISYGEERPAALGSDEGSWGLNRRVEMQKR